MTEHKKIVSLGLMSGTSMDGIDGAILVSDGEKLESFGVHKSRSYTKAEQAILKQALDAATHVKSREERPGILVEAEQLVTDVHSQVIADILQEQNTVELIGFHGQTVFHNPQERLTVQIGDAQKIANQFNIPVMSDLRVNDVLQGGQGAPLVPVYHRALVQQAGLNLPVAIVNLGGVANITVIEQEHILAFDTGPANALINDWVERHTGNPMDQDGALAAKGHVQEKFLDALFNDDYFFMPPPKSLDRDHFKQRAKLIDALSLEDGAATLTAFTAETLSLAINKYAARAECIILCGGGRHNPTLKRMIADRVRSKVLSADDLNWRGDYIEAEAFAYLAVRAKYQLPLTYPGTTGVSMPTTGGKIYLPE